MKQIVVISGKGGTGKTMLLSSFAALAKNKVLVDCDVDASNLHLMLDPKRLKKELFFGGKKAHINKNKCVSCGLCKKLCRYGAITEDLKIDEFLCEGCGFCKEACEYSAIEMKDNLSGEWYVSSSKYGPFVHARLRPAEESSGKLIARIKQEAKDIAIRDGLDYILADGPPGIGCPVMASLTGADTALIVTEPTLSGMHDMERATEITEHFKIPSKVVINKSDINPDNTKSIEAACEKKGIEVIGRIPFSESIVRSLVARTPPILGDSADIKQAICEIWEKIQ